MKKVIFGSSLSVAGIISSAIILSSGMIREWNNNGKFSFQWNLAQYGMIPVLVIFITIAVLGFIIALKGILEK